MGNKSREMFQGLVCCHIITVFLSLVCSLIQNQGNSLLALHKKGNMPVVINITSAVSENQFAEQIEKCFYFICEITGFLTVKLSWDVHGFKNLLDK